jgi:hypothetical protein
MTDQERPSECKCVETDAGMVGVYDCPLHSASPEPVPEKNDSIEAEAECLAEATGIPASVFREAMYPPEPVPEQERPETTEERYLHAMYDALRELDAHAEVSGDEYLGGAARPILRGVLEAANYPTPLHIDDDSELMQATREALSEHGAEGDEEPPSERWTIKHRLMPNGTDSAVVGTYTDWIEVVPASTLTEARREGEKWAAQAKQMARWWEQAEAELAEARQQLTAWQDGYPAAVARAETAERERDELAGEVERLQAESQIFRNALRTLAQKYGDTDLIEGPLARADREASALAEGSRDG